jgi:hypothetical protein
MQINFSLVDAFKAGFVSGFVFYPNMITNGVPEGINRKISFFLLPVIWLFFVWACLFF